MNGVQRTFEYMQINQIPVLTDSDRVPVQLFPQFIKGTHTLNALSGGVLDTVGVPCGN